MQKWGLDYDGDQGRVPRPDHDQHLPVGADRTGARLSGLRRPGLGAGRLQLPDRLAGPRAARAVRHHHRLDLAALRRRRHRRGAAAPRPHRRGHVHRRVAGRDRRLRPGRVAARLRRQRPALRPRRQPLAARRAARRLSLRRRGSLDRHRRARRRRLARLVRGDGRPAWATAAELATLDGRLRAVDEIERSSRRGRAPQDAADARRDSCRRPASTRRRWPTCRTCSPIRSSPTAATSPSSRTRWSAATSSKRRACASPPRRCSSPGRRRCLGGRQRGDVLRAARHDARRSSMSCRGRRARLRDTPPPDTEALSVNASSAARSSPRRTVSSRRSTGRPTQPAERVALVLHPHPLYGGTMHNKVVYHTAKALEAAGFVTLRFNFRGVEGSSGAHDDGRGEVEDARVALDWLLARAAGGARGAGRRLLVRRLGGAALRLCDARVQRIIAIGTPGRWLSAAAARSPARSRSISSTARATTSRRSPTSRRCSPDARRSAPTARARRAGGRAFLRRPARRAGRASCRRSPCERCGCSPSICRSPSSAPYACIHDADIAAAPAAVFETLADLDSWPQRFGAATHGEWITSPPHGIGAVRAVQVGDALSGRMLRRLGAGCALQPSR